MNDDITHQLSFAIINYIIYHVCPFFMFKLNHHFCPSFLAKSPLDVWTIDFAPHRGTRRFRSSLELLRGFRGVAEHPGALVQRPGGGDLWCVGRCLLWGARGWMGKVKLRESLGLGEFWESMITGYILSAWFLSTDINICTWYII